ncbi:MAG: YbbR-like domain-containing protein [Planctomycetota bacterium]|jgi:hypothetical protein
MSDKLKKFLAIVFLTLLIWTWAFMSKAKDDSFPGTLKVSPGADPSLLVTFSLDSGGVPQTEITLSSLKFVGAPSELTDLRKRYTLPLDNPDVERLNFYYDPAERTEGSYSLNLLDQLQKNIKIQDLALTLESCAPSQVTVNIEQLEKRELPVECVDGNGQQLKGASIDPPNVNVYVREGYPVDSATVVLSPQLIDTVRKHPVEATPYVELGVAGVRREAENPVRITLKGEGQLESQTFKTAKPIGITMSQELRAKYEVIIEDDTKARETTTIFATDEAFKAYEDMTYPLQIEIKENDIINLSQVIPKKIIYNFPPEYVRSGEIERDKTKLPVSVTIKIELLNSAAAP